MPLLLRWPRGLGRTPHTIETRISHLDVLPTLAELAGVAHDGTSDGRSFAQLLREPPRAAAGPAEDADVPLFVEIGFSRTVAVGGWKLIVVLLPSAAGP